MKNTAARDQDLNRLDQAWQHLTEWQKKWIYARVMVAAMQARAARWVWARMPQ